MGLPAWLVWGAVCLAVMDLGQLLQRRLEPTVMAAFDDGYIIPYEYVGSVPCGAAGLAWVELWVRAGRDRRNWLLPGQDAQNAG